MKNMASTSNESVTIVCKDQEIIEWSRLQLASYCDYFRVLLYGKFAETTMGTINMKHCKASAIATLLNFCRVKNERATRFDDPHFSEIPFEDATTAAEIMQVADMLGMEEAVFECEKYFLQTINLYDPADLYHLAELTSSTPIMREIVRNLRVASIQNGQSNCTCEVQSSEICVGCLCDGAAYNDMEAVYIIGGNYHQNIANCVSVNLPAFKNDSGVLSELNVSRQSQSCAKSQYKYTASYSGPVREEYRVAGLHTDIFLTGGYDVEARATSQVWKYDTREDKWSRVCDMRKPRFYHCIVSIGQHIYVCGGFDDNYVLNTLERYHPHYNEWVDLCVMPTGVGNAAYASDETGIYTCCGQYGYKESHTTNDVQYYLVSTDQWSILAAYESPVFYPQSEYGLSAAVVEHDLIVFGGQTVRCDAFNVGTKKWRRLANMKCRRMESGSVVLGDKLYSIGGYDYKTGKYHDTVEQYDRINDSWKIVETTLPQPARSMGVCYIFDVQLQPQNNHIGDK